MQVVEKNMEETVYPTFIVVLTEVSSLYFPGDEWYECFACVLSHFSHVQLFVTPWTVACLAPLSMGFSRQ